MFRAANQRGNSILDASVNVSLAGNYTTREGVQMRRFQELKLVRSNNPLFALSWTVMHPIDQDSPLYGLGLAEMIEHDMEIVVMMSGMDETIADRIYARHAYLAEEILWQRRFVDVVSVTPGGQRMVDLIRFHDTRGTRLKRGLYAAKKQHRRGGGCLGGLAALGGKAFGNLIRRRQQRRRQRGGIERQEQTARHRVLQIRAQIVKPRAQIRRIKRRRPLRI